MASESDKDIHKSEALHTQIETLPLLTGKGALLLQ